MRENDRNGYTFATRTASYANKNPRTHRPRGVNCRSRRCFYWCTRRKRGTAANEPTTNATYIETGEFDAAVVPEAFSLLNQLAFERIFPAAQRYNVGLVGATPLEQGILTTGPIEGVHYLDRKFDAATIERVRRIQAICREYSVPMNAVALQWCTRNPLVASTVPGARTPDEARSNTIGGTIQIPEQLWHNLVSAM